MIFKETQNSKSLLDFLVQIMPDWQNQVREFKKSPRYLVNGKAAKTLFALWKDEKNKVDDKVLKRPTSVSQAEVKEMTEAGLVKDLGDKIEVTKKGSDVIQTMILGDDKSVWEDNGHDLPFEVAYANTKVRGKTARKQATWQDMEGHAPKTDIDKFVDDQDEEKGLNQPDGDEEEPAPQKPINWWKKLKNAQVEPDAQPQVPTPTQPQIDENKCWQVFDGQTKQPVGPPTSSIRARNRAQKLGLEYGSYNRYVARRICPWN